MNAREARLLRVMARDLSSSVAPLIDSASAKERLRFAEMMLVRRRSNGRETPACGHYRI
jgi:hypothetical protein